MWYVIAVLVTVIAVLSVGYYRGWFAVGSRHNKEIANIKVGVDKGKISAAKVKVADKM